MCLTYFINKFTGELLVTYSPDKNPKNCDYSHANDDGWLRITSDQYELYRKAIRFAVNGRV